jgi:hypothetical protein
MPRCCASRRHPLGSEDCPAMQRQVLHRRRSGPALIAMLQGGPSAVVHAHADRDHRVRALSESVTHGECLRSRSQAGSPCSRARAAWISGLLGCVLCRHGLRVRSCSGADRRVRLFGSRRVCAAVSVGVGVPGPDEAPVSRENGRSWRVPIGNTRARFYPALL